jgi:hypothetical protein
MRASRGSRDLDPHIRKNLNDRYQGQRSRDKVYLALATSGDAQGRSMLPLGRVAPAAGDPVPLTEPFPGNAG